MQRLIDRELSQMAMLELLGSKRLLGSLVFGEGTMLRLCHDLPRYSSDMVFWLFRDEGYQQFPDRLHDALSNDYDIRLVHNNSHSIRLEARGQRRMRGLKIGIRKAVAPCGSSEEKIAFSCHSPTQVLVRGFSLVHALRHKVVALLDHGNMRDAFDLDFLMSRGVALDLSEEERERVMRRLTEFKKKDFEVELGPFLLPEVRQYYRRHGFAQLEEKLPVGT